ncbi:Uncharacterised protein [Providencia rustigianii]|nr:Uncharacterised protein [Providencia rustigianii]
MSNPANFNGQRPVINPDDAVMLLIDHQSGLFQTVGDMPMTELRARASVLAKMASLANIPVITTASVPQGPNGPLIPEIHQNAPMRNILLVVVKLMRGITLNLLLRSKRRVKSS